MHEVRGRTRFVVSALVLLAATGLSAEDPPAGRIGFGLRGEYFARTMGLDCEDGGRPVLVRVDPRIDFDWGEGAPSEEVGANIYSIRWTGWLVPPSAGEYTLHLASDDGSRLWIDGELLVDNWGDHAMEEKSARVDFKKGAARRVRIEFYENMLYAGVRLEWTAPGRGREVIPARFLFGPEADFTPPFVATVAAGGGLRQKVGSKVKVVVSEQGGERGLSGRLRISSEAAGYEHEVSEFHSLPGGVYLAEWDTAGLEPSEDYALEVTLTDAAGNSDPDGLPRTPDLVIALEPVMKICSLGDPHEGPPRPGCIAGAGRGDGPGAALLALALLARAVAAAVRTESRRRAKAAIATARGRR